jgi:hypothetical protein
MIRKYNLRSTAIRIGLLQSKAMILVLTCLGLFWSHADGYAQEAKPDLVLHGTVTYADRQTYLELPFNVAKGVTRVSVELSYTDATSTPLLIWVSSTASAFADGAAATRATSPSPRPTLRRLIFRE